MNCILQGQGAKSFNGRVGDIISQQNDYTAKMVNAIGTNGDKNITILSNQTLSKNYPYIQYYPKQVRPESLDDLAWEGKSYRDIFQGANFVYEDFDKSTASWLGHSDDRPNLKFWVYGTSGRTDMSSLVTYSGVRSLIVENTDVSLATSYQLQSMRKYHYAQEDQVYAASMLRVDRITLGSQTAQAYQGCGLTIRLTDDFSKNVTAVQKKTTSGFVLTSTLGTIEQAGDYSLHLGCLGGYINALCYIDSPVIINLSNLFDTPPDKSTMDLLYSNYIELIRGSTPQLVSIPSWTSKSPMEFSDQECIDAFMEEVNRKAAQIGMTNSTFVTPSGIVSSGNSNKSTAGDMARMVAAAIGYPEIGRIWRKKSLDIELGGCEKRVLSLSHTIKFDDLEGTIYSEESHPYLGAKGGTWGNNLSLVAVTLSNKGSLLAHAITTTGSSIYPTIGKLTDLAERALAGEDISQETVPNVSGAVTVLVPSGATWLFDDYSYEVLYQSGADSSFNPASTTKIITAMVALDWCPNIRTTKIIFKPFDNVGYSGNRFLMGQIMNVEAALQAMLIISSNNAAHAIARTIGEIILKSTIN